MNTCHAELKVDWFRIISDLCAKGYTHASIAVSVNGVNYNTVRYWRDGGAPRYEDGEQLIQLWCNVTGKCKEIIPRIRRQSASADQSASSIH